MKRLRNAYYIMKRIVIQYLFRLSLKPEGTTMPVTEPERATFSPEELQTLLGVGRRKVYDGLNSGAIPSIRLGKRFIIPRASIQDWLRNAGGNLKVNP